MPFNLKFDVAAMHFILQTQNLVLTAKKKHNQKHKRTTQPKIQKRTTHKKKLWMKTLSNSTQTQ